MKSKLWNKRIPTLVALAIVFASIWITSFIIQRQVLLSGKASADTTPYNISITNTTDTSFTVAYTTNEKTTGAVSLKGESGEIFSDDRNRRSKNPSAFYSHYITVAKLKPSTEYSFAIISNGTAYSDNGKNFRAKTGPPLSPATNGKSLRGQIILPTGEGGDDVLLLIAVSGAELYSTLTSQNGTYNFLLDNIRSKSLDSLISFDDTTKITITAYRQDMRSIIELQGKTLINIPIIQLSSNYTFLSEEETQIASASSSLLTIPTLKNERGEIRILSPRNNASLIDVQPVFQGYALPHQKVKITIHSKENIQVAVTADSNGFWSFRPPRAISAGAHIITIETIGTNGILRQITQSFSVFAIGYQLNEPNPSVTPIMTITPIPTSPQVVTPTTIPSAATPSPASSPTPTPTIFVPTSPPITQYPTEKLPSPGNNTTYFLTVISIGFILAGTILFFVFG